MAERHLYTEILEIDKLIKKNDLQEISNPIFFIRNGVPTPDGLLSNDIFGISKDQRANVFAYIDLTEYFLNPLVYKIWSSMDRRLREIVHGTKKFIIDENGQFIEDEKGDNGLKFIKKNLDKIKIKTTDSYKRDDNIKFLNDNKDKLFMNKMLVIPAYFRDVNTERGRVGVGDVNKLYDSLLIAVRALKETADYGLNMSNATRGRIQEILLEIYNWFSKEPNISKKFGIIRRSVMSKTSDYASRLVLSAPELRVEKLEDMMVTLDRSAIPLSSLCVNLYPQMIFWLRRFFENEFSGTNMYPYIEKDTKQLKYMKVKDPLIEFSDTRIKKELDRFIHGYSNRFIPIEIPNEEDKKVYMRFKGRNTLSDNLNAPETTPLINRKLTWCDLFYMAAVDVSADKCTLITRYPLDNFHGQFPTTIAVSSTKDTEPMYYNNKFYKFYPKIREEDIGQDTSNKFIDTMSISNLLIGAMGADYDGDQVTSKTAYTIEANEELMKYINSKKFYMNLGGKNIRTCSNEAIQCLYNLTMILPGSEVEKPVFEKDIW